MSEAHSSASPYPRRRPAPADLASGSSRSLPTPARGSALAPPRHLAARDHVVVSFDGLDAGQGRRARSAAEPAGAGTRGSWRGRASRSGRARRDQPRGGAPRRSAPAGDHLRQQGVEPPAHLVAPATPASTRRPPRRRSESGAPAGQRTATTRPADGRNSRGRVLRVEADLDRMPARPPAAPRSRAAPAQDPRAVPRRQCSWTATRSRPSTSSVTGCSTWSRAFISRNTNDPSSPTRNSQVPAFA